MNIKINEYIYLTMTKYTCKRCLKEFTQKSHYKKHLERKTPCQDNSNKIKEIVNNILSETIEHIPDPIISDSVETIHLIQNDCLKELEKLQDNSVDCVITDPPYFIDKLDNNWNSDDINSDVKNSHISHLPKGMKFSKNQVKELYDFYFQFSSLLFSKLKPGGFFLSFSSPRLYHSIAMACELSGF